MCPCAALSLSGGEERSHRAAQYDPVLRALPHGEGPGAYNTPLKASNTLWKAQNKKQLKACQTFCYFAITHLRRGADTQSFMSIYLFSQRQIIIFLGYMFIAQRYFFYILRGISLFLMGLYTYILRERLRRSARTSWPCL